MVRHYTDNNDNDDNDDSNDNDDNDDNNNIKSFLLVPTITLPTTEVTTMRENAEVQAKSKRLHSLKMC